MGLNTQQMDVDTEFLNKKINPEVNVHQPKGYEDGTRQAPHNNCNLFVNKICC